MYRLKPLPDPVSPDLLSRLAKLETATLGHTEQLGFADPAIQAVGTARTVVGTAVTLALPGQDSTLLHHITGMLRLGDVLVIDRLGDMKHASFGGGVALNCVRQGFVGAIIDGTHTDTSEIVECQFPVWSRGPSPVTTRILDVGGAFNVPVCCGGAAVLPGYAVIADESGVLFIAPDELEEAIHTAEEKTERGSKSQARVKAGEKLGDISGASAKVAAKTR